MPRSVAILLICPPANKSQRIATTRIRRGLSPGLPFEAANFKPSQRNARSRQSRALRQRCRGTARKTAQRCEGKKKRESAAAAVVEEVEGFPSVGIPTKSKAAEAWEAQADGVELDDARQRHRVGLGSREGMPKEPKTCPEAVRSEGSSRASKSASRTLSSGEPSFRTEHRWVGSPPGKRTKTALPTEDEGPKAGDVAMEVVLVGRRHSRQDRRLD